MILTLVLLIVVLAEMMVSSISAHPSPAHVIPPGLLMGKVMPSHRAVNTSVVLRVHLDSMEGATVADLIDIAANFVPFVDSTSPYFGQLVRMHLRDARLKMQKNLHSELSPATVLAPQ